MVVWDLPTARSLRRVPWAIPSLPTTDRRGSVLVVNLESRERRGLHELLAQPPLVLEEQDCTELAEPSEQSSSAREDRCPEEGAEEGSEGVLTHHRGVAVAAPVRAEPTTTVSCPSCGRWREVSVRQARRDYIRGGRRALPGVLLFFGSS
jgi:hypothetical protein